MAGIRLGRKEENKNNHDWLLTSIFDWSIMTICTSKLSTDSMTFTAPVVTPAVNNETGLKWASVVFTDTRALVSFVPPSAAAMFTFCGDVVLKRKVLCRLKKMFFLVSVNISLPLNNTDDICYTFDPLMWIIFYVADENIQDSLIKGLSDIRCLFHLFRWRWKFNNYFKDFVSNPFLNNAVYIIWDTRTN